ncbi:hypothetical protein I552_0300 [Mycobacterium xenopi 3993]|nr:hypothetical protein I552_0300 [Mycobacterium xenopi 3993]
MGNVAKVSDVVTPKLPPRRRAMPRTGRVAGGRHGDRLSAGQHQRRRRQGVTHQARMTGMRAQPAAQGMPGGADRRAGAGRDTPAGPASAWCSAYKSVAGVTVTYPVAGRN